MRSFSIRRVALLALLASLAVSAVRCTEPVELEQEDEDVYADDYNSGYDGELDVSGKQEYPQNEPNYNQPPYPGPPPPPQVPIYGNEAAAYEGYPGPSYSLPPPPPPVYQAPPPPVYQAPLPPPPVYQAPPPPPPPVYQEAPPVYDLQPVANYSVPPPLPQPVYQAPPVYQEALPVYAAPPVSNYSAPSYKANYSAPAPAYPAPPAYQPAYQPAGNYSQQVYVQAPNVSYPVGQPITKYSVADLAPLLSPYGYRSNHPSLLYYRSSPYRQCPKHLYQAAPAYKDIEAAVAFAASQLAAFRGAGLQYMNASQPSWAARHQVFSYLSQASARMDEEGLLIEFISLYLSERACLTKWDKQRYLPQLTRLISTNQLPGSHACSQYYNNQWQGQLKYCAQSKYRTYDGFCNNPYHPYWGKANVCHLRLLSPDYADGIQLPRGSAPGGRYPLPNPRTISNYIHNEVPIDGPYNHMKMQWGQFINHDITNTGLSTYDGLVDCCKQPGTRGCWPILVPPGDKFYGYHNVTCLNFIRSGVCPTCQLGPRQQYNKNTAFLDLSHVYGNSAQQALKLRTFAKGLLRSSPAKNGEELLPVGTGQDQCQGTCYEAGDTRVNQHPALTALHVLLLRNHNHHATQLARQHRDWNDELLYQEARRINIAEYQMITYAEYLPIVFGPVLSAYYRLLPQPSGHTYYDPKVDPTTWNEYSTATCRFGHSQIQSTFGMYAKIFAYGQRDPKASAFRLKEWFMRPSLLADGQMQPILNGLLGGPASTVDPWLTDDVRNHLYQSHKEHSGGDLAATNIWRGRDHGLPGYVHYVEYCFNVKIRGWKDLAMFIPWQPLQSLRKVYRVVENIDLFTGGMSERHFPGADIGPTFACVNGIQYYHLKFGDRFYFEHGGQAASFAPAQLAELRRATLARLLCRAGHLPAVPQYAFLQPSYYNPLVDCAHLGRFDYSKF